MHSNPVAAFAELTLRLGSTDQFVLLYAHSSLDLFVLLAYFPADHHDLFLILFRLSHDHLHYNPWIVQITSLMFTIFFLNTKTLLKNV